MLERMRVALERIETLKSSFRGMSPRHVRRENQSFINAVKDAENSVQTKSNPQLSVAPVEARSDVSNAAETQLKEYLDLINYHSSRNNLDPKLVKRLIEVESGFNPKAVSRKGAMGLMQLMPDTALQMGVSNPYDPSQNISGGTDYLASLLRQNDGNLRLALAAYNAGPGKVKQYGGVPPFSETIRFIDKVMTDLHDEDDR